MKKSLLVALTLSSVSCISANASESFMLTAKEKQMVEWVDSQQDAMLSELAEHVNLNTGTSNIEGLNSYRELLQAELEDLGFITKTVSSKPLEVLSCKGAKQNIADHLVARRASSKGIKLLLNGHLDTVFEPSDEFQRLEVLENGVLKGPGVVDMKGGLVVMLTALRAMNQSGLLDQAQLTVLLNTDEEIGSLGSRPLIEKLAKEHDIGLVFEGSYKNKFTRARKGLGQTRVRITGRESHAGAAHQNGVSASLELAHKVIALEQLTDYDNDTTVNVGVMAGGEKRNTVPGCADAYIDMRFPDRKTGEALKTNIGEILATASTSNPRYEGLPKIDSWSVLHRPAKEAHPKVDELIKLAMQISKEVGEPIVGSSYSGGGTDGSIAQAKGLVTLDSLGLDGKGAHSSREEASVQSLMARSKLAAILISRLITQKP